MQGSWSGTLWLRTFLLMVLGGGIVAGVWLVSAGLARDQEATGNDNKGAPISSSKPVQGKPITLDEARLLVQKSGKGDIIKADVTGAGAKTLFSIAVRGKDQSKTLYMDGSGTVLIENPERPRTKRNTSPTKKRERERERRGKERERERRDD